MSRLLRAEKDYTVGWICALPIELAAGTQILDEEHEVLPHNPKHPNDNNQYTFGSIDDPNGSKHNVVIACLPYGIVGISSAASVAEQMKSRFKAIHFILMVGVGGGVPSGDNDVRLGDVVVSKPSLNHGGVVQHDSGKTLPNGLFIKTGHLNKPPDFLLSALAKMEAKSILGKTNIPKILGAFSSMPQFAYSEARQDILFEAGYNHTGGKQCNGCDLNRTVARSKRSSNAVVVHYGTIASGSVVMKDAVVRDRISEDFGGILCFDMEAAGLMNSFPCLVIRGISDYADSHKNDEWHAYAAAVAAAYAKDLLSTIPVKADATASTTGPQIPRSERRKTPPTAFDIEVMREKNMREWLESFATTARDVKFQEASDSRAPDTCQWIEGDASFTWWRAQDTSAILWLTGLPGIGKTTIATYVVQRLQAEIKANVTPSVSDNIVLVVVCNDQTMKSGEAILSNIVGQLLLSSPSDLQKSATQLCETLRRAPRESEFKILWEIFAHLVQNSCFNCIYFVIDGLDECENKCVGELLETVKRNLVWSKKVLYFISSRPCESIRQHIEEFPDSSYRLLATEDNYAPIIQDVARYVDHVVIPKLKKHRGFSDDEGEKIREHLISKPACMFLYVKLLYQTLLKTEVSRLEETLAETPFNIHEFYRHILDKIDPSVRARQSELLLCLLYSFRPLDLEELDFARSQRKFPHLLAIRGHTNKGNLEGLKKDLRLLSPLITYRESDGTVEFCHHSAKERLLHEANSPQSSYYPFLATKHDAHTYMAIGCLKLLTQITHLPYPTRHDDFWRTKLEALGHDYFMITYALDYWHSHCLESFQGPGDELGNSELLELLFLLDDLRQAPGSNRFWSAVIWRAGSSLRLGYHELGYSVHTVEKLRKLTSVEFFSALGIPHLLRLAIRNNQRKESQALIRRNSRHAGALRLAVSSGNLENVNTILEYLNLSSLDDTTYRGAIVYAAQLDEPPLFQRLLSLRPRLDMLEIASSFLEASIKNSEEILQSLLHRIRSEYHALVGSLRDEHGMTILHWLCAVSISTKLDHFNSKYLDTIATVMHLGGDINAQDIVGNTPLHYYCMRTEPSSDLVTGVVTLGADPSLQNNAGWLPYHLAARRAREVKTLEALASTDSSLIRRKTLGGFTALHWAALRWWHTTEDTDIVRHLLQQGLDPFARTKKGKTPLEIAATDGSLTGFQWATTTFDGIDVTIVFGVEYRRTPAEISDHAIEEVSEGEDADKHRQVIERPLITRTDSDAGVGGLVTARTNTDTGVSGLRTTKTNMWMRLRGFRTAKTDASRRLKGPEIAKTDMWTRLKGVRTGKTVTRVDT